MTILHKITYLGIDDDKNYVLNISTKNDKDGTDQHSSKTIETSATFYFDENNDLLNIELPISKEL